MRSCPTRAVKGKTGRRVAVIIALVMASNLRLSNTPDTLVPSTDKVAVVLSRHLAADQTRQQKRLLENERHADAKTGDAGDQAEG